MGDLGTLPARPLAAALAGTGSPYHRMLMVVLLREVSPPFDVEVIVALTQVLMGDPSEQVRDLAGETLGILRKRSLKLDPKAGSPGGQPARRSAWDAQREEWAMSRAAIVNPDGPWSDALIGSTDWPVGLAGSNKFVLRF